jgi:nitrite reductase/ring-hydroxylating ferredoxin subunit
MVFPRRLQWASGRVRTGVVMKQLLCAESEVPAEGAKEVDFFGRPALLYRRDEAIVGALSICSHLGGPLELRRDQLVCPWHGASFDATSGKCARGPARSDARAMLLPLRIQDGSIYYVWGE